MNTVTGDIVFEKDGYSKRPMASTTKIMTLLAALLNSKPDEIVTVSRNAAYQEGSSAYLKPDAKITMKDLCYGLMLNSGNDAAVAIAEHISGNSEEFAKLMNSTAREIGLQNTNFVTPNGLHDDMHYTTAEELAKITQYALQNKFFCEIAASKIYTSTMKMPDGENINVEYINHNRLLGEVEGCIGVKTGFTKTAGRCLVSAVNRDGAQYIIVTLNDPNDWQTHKQLYEEVLKNASCKHIVKKGDCIEHAVSGKAECSLVADSDFSVYVNGFKNRFEVVKHIPNTIDFPVNKGEKIGYIQITADDKEIGRVDVVAEKDFAPKAEVSVKNCYMFTVINLLRNIL